MTKSNWFYEKKQDISYEHTMNQDNIYCFENFQDSKLESLREKPKAYNSIENILESTIGFEGRIDVQMKSMLRKIKRDFKHMFIQFTHFDVKIKSNLIVIFMRCLEAYSPFVFGENPTRKQVFILEKNEEDEDEEEKEPIKREFTEQIAYLENSIDFKCWNVHCEDEDGSLICNKYIQQYIHAQRTALSTEEKEIQRFASDCNKVHLTLYKYSEARLADLCAISEFRDIITMHSKLWSANEMKQIDRLFYNKIVSMTTAYFENSES